MGLFDDAASVISHKSGHRSHSQSRQHHSSSSKDKRRSGTYSISSRKSNKSRSRSRSRSRSPGAKSFAGSFFGLGDDGDKHRRHSKHSNSGFFGLGDDREDKNRRHSKHNNSGFFGLPNVSTRSFFGGGDKHRSSTSHYRRSPRSNFVTRAYKQLKRLLRDLVYYAKRHPLKVFTLVVVPLITGGFLTALLARFGLRLPPSLERMLGLGARAMGGGGGGALGSIGLVGEAVRMASGMGGGHADVRVERGRDGGMQWERKSWEREGEGFLGGGWGGGMMKTVSDFFD